MTLKEMKKYALELIEEIDPTKSALTNDPDIEAKMHGVINHVMYEAARIKKIPDYVEIEVVAGQKITFSDIESEGGYEVYQLDVVRGASHDIKANGTIIKVLEDGILEIEYFRYPERIKENTKDNYEFELSADVLEIMPYGIAADLLKSDVSTKYGSVYSQRYETMLQRLDSRYSMGSITFEGGVDI
jgi:hypothetical protein